MQGRFTVTFADEGAGYEDGHRSVEVQFNCYHVEVHEWDRKHSGRVGEPLFHRRPENDEWLDKDHRAITDALSALEEAVTRAIRAHPDQMAVEG